MRVGMRMRTGTRTLSPSYVCLDCRHRLRQKLRSISLLRACTFTTSTTRFLPNTSPNSSTSNSESSSNHKPPTAPKPTPNVRHIRENADVYARNCVDRNYAALRENPLKIKELADEAARLQRDLNAPRGRIKAVEKEIGRISFKAKGNDKKDSKDGNNVDEQLAKLHAEAKQLKEETADMSLRRERCLEDMRSLALSLPNLTSPQTPIGDTPRLLSYINYDPSRPPSYLTDPSRSHVSIGSRLSLLDFSSSATSTGWGWYYLTGAGALLEQALVQFALTSAMNRGWTPVSPPSIVYSHIASACGFQPRDQHNEQQIFAIEQSERDKERGRPARVLAGTAEIPLAAMYAGREVGAGELPVRMVGASRCYRAEAGSRGVEAKGLYRVHEFTKVELFGWADSFEESNSPSSSSPSSSGKSKTPDDKKQITSTTLFDEMLALQTHILSALNLPCRILEMPSSDLGASATRKIDIEALFPSRLQLKSSPSSPFPSLSEKDLDSAWGEVTSASICTDYQSRRLGTRVRSKDGAGSRFPHTVNGTALAVPRVIAAILENGWDERVQGVVVPEVLRGFMGGVEVLRGNLRG